MPNIDQLIDATSGHVMLNFLDAFSGYNQVKMNMDDIPKTTFITHQAVYVYMLMTFGPRNVGSTYQRVMDYMIAKSTTIPNHIADLKECFENVRKHKLKLNPEKCIFGVEAGKFLGFMINNWGIEANPEKIKTIQQMQPQGMFRNR